MADTKSRALWLADIADDNSPTTADCEAIAAELRRLDAVVAGLNRLHVTRLQENAEQLRHILALTAERDALANRITSMAETIDHYGEFVERLTAERDALRAEVERLTAGDVRYLNEVEALRRDAERYRWLCKATGDWGVCEWDSGYSEWVRDSRGQDVISRAIDRARGAV